MWVYVRSRAYFCTCRTKLSAVCVQKIAIYVYSNARLLCVRLHVYHRLNIAIFPPIHRFSMNFFILSIHIVLCRFRILLPTYEYLWLESAI